MPVVFPAMLLGSWGDDRAESTVSDDIVAKRTGRVVSGFHLSDCDKQSRKE
jgi:hypothetical protein